jgi:ABC-type Fe3+/spermidine/putrescine transport system ATPase subunit
MTMLAGRERAESVPPTGGTVAAGAAHGAAVSLDGVRRSFAGVAAVDDVSLQIRPGEVFTLLGPSGCGKTTTLRIIAGLETAVAGEVRIGERVVVSPRGRVFVAPHRRNIGMVFQSYAIWPHMTVFENVAYPLRVRRTRGDEVRRRVEEMLDSVQLGRLATKPAHQLSGGEQQRVAFARALVGEPSLLLLDEPFSNLDAKLREQMRVQVKDLLDRHSEVTVLFVTHDQSEALSLSDRIGVMNTGRLEQIGTPREVYETPATPFVRDFLGRTILFRAAVDGTTSGERVLARLTDQAGAAVNVERPSRWSGAAGEGLVAVRPEDVDIRAWGPDDAEGSSISGVVTALTFVGDHLECNITVGPGGPVRLRTDRDARLERGQRVALVLRPGAARLWLD